MPELPEVETVANDLRRSSLLDVPILGVRVFWPKTVNFSPEALYGQKLINVGRRGKYLILALADRRALVVHLRMTGKILIKTAHSPPLPHEHLIITFVNGQALHYHDTRKFGRWALVDDSEAFLKKIGPEPLSTSFSEPVFSDRLKRFCRQLKPLLLDQAFIVGLGNIYVDEALWRARLHPQILSDTLTRQQADDLFHAIRYVLLRGLKTQGTTLGFGASNFYRPDGKKGNHQDTLDVFRRTGLPCPTCGTPIIRLLVGQRSTHICPRCQK